MLAQIYFSNGVPVAVSSSNPLPVTLSSYSADSFNSTVTYDNASVLSVVKSATASESIYVTDLVISSSAAMYLIFKDNSGNILINRTYVAANSNTPLSFNTPIKVAAGKALMVISSVAAPVTITVSGMVY